MSRNAGGVKAYHVLFLVIVIAAAVWAVSHWRSDERQIRRQLGQLAELLEKPAGESALAGANQVRQIGDLLTTNFEIDIAPYGQVVRDRQELLRTAMGYRSRVETAGLAFRGVEIELGNAGRTATLQAVAVLSGRDAAGPRRDAYRVALDWVEQGGEWKISRIDVVEQVGSGL